MAFDHFFARISCALLIADHGEFLDLGICPEVYMDSCGLNNISEGMNQEFREILHRFDSHTLHAPFLDISTGGNDNDIRELSYEKLSAVVRLGKEWGSDLIVIHYNYDRLYYRQSLDRWMERSVEFFKRLAAIPDHPLIAIENIDDPIPDVALELERRVGSDRIIHCFDFGHHKVFGKISSAEWLGRIRSDKHIHFHFHDNDGSGDDHLPLGLGTIDWAGAKEDILSLGSPFSVTLEPHSKEDLLRSLRFYKTHFLEEKDSP